MPSDGVQNLWRIYRTFTKIWHTRSGYTRTLIREYDELLLGVTSNTISDTYSPSYATFVTQISDFNQGRTLDQNAWELDWQNGTEYITTAYGSNGAYIEAFLGERVTDAQVWVRMKELMDAVDWDSVAESTIEKFPLVTGAEFENPGWFLITNAEASLYTSYPLPSSCPKTVPVLGYALQSITRGPKGKDYVLQRVRFPGSTCLQTSDLDLEGFATSWAFSKKTTGHFIDVAEDLGLENDIPESYDPTDEGSYWTLPAVLGILHIDPDAARRIVVPFKGARHSTVDNSELETRYFYTGAQFDVDEEEPDDCPASGPTFGEQTGTFGDSPQTFGQI